MKPLIYLGIPYSSPSEQVKAERFVIACKIAGALRKQGILCFSPISESHSIAQHADVPTTWEFWKEYDEAIIRCCKELWVIRIAGLDDSIGVAAEIKLAQELKLPIKYIHPEKYGVDQGTHNVLWCNAQIRIENSD